jgi:hypothetical protein
LQAKSGFRRLKIILAEETRLTAEKQGVFVDKLT